MPPIKEICHQSKIGKNYTHECPQIKNVKVHTCMPPQNNRAPKVKNKFAPNSTLDKSTHMHTNIR